MVHSKKKKEKEYGKCIQNMFGWIKNRKLIYAKLESTSLKQL